MAPITDPSPSAGVKSIASLKRGLDVLRAIEWASAVTFTELQKQIGLPKATLARILKTLLENGWIRRSAIDGRFACEPMAGLSSSVNEAIAALAAAALPIRSRLRRQIPWPVDLGVRDRDSMLIVDSAETEALSLAANYRLLGFRPPMLRSSLGRCYLSYCPDDEREEILQSLSRSRNEADRAALGPANIRRMVEQTRASGYALREASHTPVSSPERYGAIAVPVFCGAQLIGCVSCSWLPAIATTQDICRSCLGHLKDAAKALGAAVDGRSRT